ncbi:MAG TPA: carboxypeptidase regulatory-like domain-containing protein [Rhodothermales bacterium]|nr:carboxypeptidase regulatory-like domain-containing protein [Rhodothermales bacterium]
MKTAFSSFLLRLTGFLLLLPMSLRAQSGEWSVLVSGIPSNPPSTVSSLLDLLDSGKITVSVRYTGSNSPTVYVNVLVTSDLAGTTGVAANGVGTALDRAKALGLNTSKILATAFSEAHTMQKGPFSEVRTLRNWAGDLSWRTNYDSKLRNTLIQTNSLPEGQHGLYVWLSTKPDGQGDLVAEYAYSTQFSSPEPPLLLSPLHQTTLQEAYPRFTWQAATASYPMGDVFYQLRIVEVLPGQRPEQALRTNPGYFTTSIKNATQFAYPTDALKLEHGRTYAWEVAALDANNQPIATRFRSEAFSFSYSDPQEQGYVTAIKPTKSDFRAGDRLMVQAQLVPSHHKNPGVWSAFGVEKVLITDDKFNMADLQTPGVFDRLMLSILPGFTPSREVLLLQNQAIQGTEWTLDDVGQSYVLAWRFIGKTVSDNQYSTVQYVLVRSAASAQLRLAQAGNQTSKTLNDPLPFSFTKLPETGWSGLTLKAFLYPVSEAADENATAQTLFGQFSTLHNQPPPGIQTWQQALGSTTNGVLSLPRNDIEGPAFVAFRVEGMINNQVVRSGVGLYKLTQPPSNHVLRRIAGTVTNLAGDPLGSYDVTLRFTTAIGQIRRAITLNTRTDANGMYRFELELPKLEAPTDRDPLSFECSVDGKAYYFSQVREGLLRGQNIDNIDFILSPDRQDFVFMGDVEDEAGFNVEDAQVVFQTRNAALGIAAIWEPLQPYTAQTIGNGKFQIRYSFPTSQTPTEANPKEFRLRVVPPANLTGKLLERTYTGFLTGRDILNFAVELPGVGGQITGRLERMGTGEAMTNGTVELRDANGQTLQRSGLRNGGFAFRNLLPGTYNLYFVKNGYQSALHPHNSILAGGIRVNWADQINVQTLRAKPLDKPFYLSARNRDNEPASSTIFVMNSAQFQAFQSWRLMNTCASAMPLPVLFTYNSVAEANANSEQHLHILPVLDGDFGDVAYHFVYFLSGHGFRMRTVQATTDVPETQQVRLTACPTTISGVVRRSDTNEPVSDAFVQIQAGDVTYAQNTNADGLYVFQGISAGSYTITAQKTGIGSIRIAGIQVDAASQRQVDLMIIRETGSLSGFVRDVNGVGRYDALVTINGLGQNTRTAADGSYRIDLIPPGEYRITASSTGLRTTTSQLTTVSVNRATSLSFSLEEVRGNVRLTIYGPRNATIPNALVEIPGTNLNQRTDENGNVLFENILAGTTTFRVSTPNGLFTPRTQTLSFAFLLSNEARASIFLNEGMVVRGFVRNNLGRPLSGVQVRMESRPDLAATTNELGEYLLRGIAGFNAGTVAGVNIPASTPLILATKTGFQTGSQTVTFASGETVFADFTLQPAPFDRLLGFQIFVENLREENGRRFVSGALTAIPNTPLLTLTPQIQLPFDELEIDANNRPIGGSARLSIGNLSLRLFGIEATLRGPNGQPLELIAQASGTGAIRGEILIQADRLLSLIPGASATPILISLPASCNAGPCITADGLSAFNADIVLPNLDWDIQLWGYNLKIQRLMLNRNGLCLNGEIPVTGIQPIRFTGLCISSEGRITGPTIPEFTFDISAFHFQLRTIRFDAGGLSAASGTIGINGLAANGGRLSINFRNLRISTQGQIVRADIEVPNNRLALPGFPVNITSASFVTLGQDIALRFGGNIPLPDPIGRNLTLQSLEIAQNGAVSALLPANTRFDLAGIQVLLANINLQVNGPNIRLDLGASLDFPIPGMPAPSAQMYFSHRNGNLTFGVNEVAMPRFSLGPVSLDNLRFGYQNQTFSGSLDMAIAGTMEVGGSFRYRDGRNYAFEVRNQIPIPLGPIELAGFTGGMNRQNDNWRFYLQNVQLGFPRTQDGLALVGGLDVRLSNGGPRIEIDGRMTAASGQLTLGTARLLLDVPRGRFEGNTTIGNPFDEPIRSVANAEGAVDVRVGWQPGSNDLQYWFVGARLDVDLFRVIEARGRMFAGANYRPFGDVDQRFRDYFNHHPATNDMLNGIYVSGYSGGSLDLDIIEGGANQAVYFLYDWRQRRAAGGAYARVYGTFDVYVASLGASFDVKGEVNYNGRWDIQGSANSNLKGTVWPCDSNSSCSRWCAGCLGVSAELTYRNGKFDVDVDW